MTPDAAPLTDPSRCWDCQTRRGLHPAVVDRTGQVHKVCVLCWNRHWSRWMHPTGCTCERCDQLRRALQ